MAVNLYHWFVDFALDSLEKNAKLIPDDYAYAISAGLNLYLVLTGIRKAYLSEISHATGSKIDNKIWEATRKKLKKYPAIGVYKDIIYNKDLVKRLDVKKAYKDKVSDDPTVKWNEIILGDLLGFAPCSGDFTKNTKNRYSISFEIKLLNKPNKVQIYAFVCDRIITQDLRNKMHQRATELTDAIKKINPKWVVKANIKPLKQFG